MLLPSGLFACMALLSSLVMANMARSDASTGEPLCTERVWAFLWGCVLLFYLTTASHLAALFGPRTWCRGGVAGKGAALAAIAILLALWIVFGHFVLRDNIDEGDGLCEGSVFHWLVIVDMACLYSFFLALALTVLLASLGACRSVPETAEDVHDRAQAQSLLRSQAQAGGTAGASVFRPGAGLNTSAGGAYSRRGGARIAQSPSSGAGVASNQGGWGRSRLGDLDVDGPSQFASPSHSEPVQLQMLATPSAAASGGAGGFERAFSVLSADQLQQQSQQMHPSDSSAPAPLTLEAEAEELFASRAAAAAGAQAQQQQQELRAIEESLLHGGGGGGGGPVGQDPNRLYSPVSSAAPAPALASHDRVFEDDEDAAHKLGERMPLTPKLH
jgi:hypothetical protein